MHIVADSDEEIAAIGDRLPELVARRRVGEMAAVGMVRVLCGLPLLGVGRSIFQGLC